MISACGTLFFIYTANVCKDLRIYEVILGKKQRNLIKENVKFRIDSTFVNTFAKKRFEKEQSS